jgi:tRNA-splicing ligase RtcB (3'-phosphate/5'-hydroxy nucleic acid ligase)
MTGEAEFPKLNRLEEWLWEIPRQGKMHVPGRVYGDESVLQAGSEDRSLLQVRNVSHLPGIVGYSLAMPDIHWGYGFPIGGVAATRRGDGVISPGGVGYDINCGVRLVATGLFEPEIQGKIEQIVRKLYQEIPSGVGSSGAIRRISDRELRSICTQGSRWAVDQGYGRLEDLEHTEEGGRLRGADPDRVSERALSRGLDQVGTLGSGNHFIELGVVDRIYDPHAAGVLGLESGQVTLLIHTGSRGFGYQVCDDYLKRMVRASDKYGMQLPDRQLSCAPLDSPEGLDYLAAMGCAANYAWANRQVIMTLSVRALGQALSVPEDRLKARLVYDVSHNIAKWERHVWQGEELELCVHRKGATRAFGPGHPQIPARYRGIGQPVLIPGDMGSCSFVCLGTGRAESETFGSTCHGAGRVMSRAQAKKEARGRRVAEEMKRKGIHVLARGRDTLDEEMPDAYKEIENVVRIMHEAGISRKVARLRPRGVVKG